MRFPFIAIVVVIVIGLAFLVWISLGHKDAVHTENDGGNTSQQKRDLSEVYLGLRSQALQFPPEQFDLKSKPGDPAVYGIVMDWDVGNGVATFVSFSSGEASMYTSSGGGIIGGVGRNRVKQRAVKFVENAQSYLDRAARSDDTSVATGRRVKFFFLTTNGRYVAEEALINFDNGSSPLLGLFIKANELIGELREVSEEENEK